MLAALACYCTLAARLAAEIPCGHPDSMPSPEHPIGMRGDWTGHYPGATPPTEWDLLGPEPRYRTDDHGATAGEPRSLIWRTKVGVGETPPLVIDDRLYIVADAVTVRCTKRPGLYDIRADPRDSNDHSSGCGRVAWKHHA